MALSKQVLVKHLIHGLSPRLDITRSYDGAYTMALHLSWDGEDVQASEVLTDPEDYQCIIKAATVVAKAAQHLILMTMTPDKGIRPNDMSPSQYADRYIVPVKLRCDVCSTPLVTLRDDDVLEVGCPACHPTPRVQGTTTPLKDAMARLGLQCDDEG